jgi:hypothetical protein
MGWAGKRGRQKRTISSPPQIWKRLSALRVHAHTCAPTRARLRNYFFLYDFFSNNSTSAKTLQFYKCKFFSIFKLRSTTEQMPPLVKSNVSGLSENATFE